jgi:hypothetical protein
MSNAEEETRVRENQQVIRDYLLEQFKGFQLTKAKQDGSLCHWFTVTNFTSYTQYTLKVAGPRLSDSSNTPERVKHLLDLDNVALKMRATKNGEPYSWGW